MARSPRKITYTSDFSDGRNKKSQAVLDPSRWYDASAQDVGNQMSSLAARIESSDWASSRYLQYVCSRLITGRAQPSGFGYSMTKRSGRAAQSMVAATWAPPALNVVATAADVFHQKVFKNKPWLQFLPTVKGSYKDRSRCKLLSQFVDAAFDQLNVWDKTNMCGTDCMMYPSAFVKVGRTVENDLCIERVLSSEILLTPEQSGSWLALRTCLQRTFIAKSDLYVFAVGEKAEATRAAIDNSPGVFPGFYNNGSTSYGDIAALVEGWKLPDSKGEGGRHVLAVGDTVLFDKPWKRQSLPFAKLDFSPLSNEFMGQSMAEQMLPLQRSIDRLGAAIDEIEQRWSWPRYFIENSSHVDTDQFGKDFVEYAGTKPEKDATNSVPPELYASMESKIQKAFTRVGISQDMAGGQKQEGLSSGLAILAFNQIEDSRHIDLAQRFEKFIVDIGELVIEECRELSPSFVVDGKQSIKWSDVDMNKDAYKTTCFPMSRLPQTPAARFEQINRWYLDGTISRSEKLRAESMPDLRPITDAITVSADWVENTLDQIVETGKYRPPMPYLDMASAISSAQSRLIYEDRNGLEQSRLRQLNKFLSALRELQPPEPAMIQPPSPQQVMGQPGAQAMPPAQTANLGNAAPGPAAAPGMQQ